MNQLLQSFSLIFLCFEFILDQVSVVYFYLHIYIHIHVHIHIHIHVHIHIQLYIYIYIYIYLYSGAHTLNYTQFIISKYGNTHAYVHVNDPFILNVRL